MLKKEKIRTIYWIVYYLKNYWNAKKNVSHDYISVNNDVYFVDSHIDFKRDIKKSYKDPWISPIKYCVKPRVNEENVKKAISDIEENTCIMFKKQEHCKNDTQEIVFKEGEACVSFIGHVSKNHSQIITLSSGCYINPYIILHEIGHALGLVHEHSRKDRDEYVKINLNSLISNEEGNYQIIEHPKYFNYSTAYDYSALMHYAPYDFATFWKWAFGYPVISPRLSWQYSRMMGQRKKMTFNEYKRINLCYCNWCNWADNITGKVIKNYKNNKDNKKTKNNIADCRNGGYPDFRNCSKCLCPTGYTGNLCDKIMPSDEKCGKDTKFQVNNTGASLILQGKMNCNIFLQAENKKTIELNIMYVNAPYKNKICTEDVGYQFKYRKDKGATGLLLCGTYIQNTIVTSESDSILVMYKGDSDHSLLTLFFKQIN
uniref:Metalloendopeptidase n=1 Tax=Strongyloides stercoralis TaxID=6248 RepID=A0A0K0EGS0_STRER